MLHNLQHKLTHNHYHNLPYILRHTKNIHKRMYPYILLDSCFHTS